MKRAQLEQAIAAQERLRGALPNDIVDATLAALKSQLDALTPTLEPEQQRKLVTLLFCDVVGSTTMVRDLDPEDDLALMDTGLKRLSACIDRCGGRVTRYMGDGFKALFGHPVARENDAEMAIEAGLAILQEAEAYAAVAEQAFGVKGFSVRVGINTGLVIVGGQSEGKDTVMGAAVNLAARMESNAQPGTVLISHHTHQHVRGIFDVEPQAPVAAKGFDQAVPVYRVKGILPPAMQLRPRSIEGVTTRMIGRDDEIARLQAGFQHVLRTSQARLITVVGEAGVGKSRLLDEFDHGLRLLPQEMWYLKARAFAQSADTPYALLRDLFARRFEILDTDSKETVQTKLTQGLAAFDIGDAETKARILGTLLGYDLGDVADLLGMRDDSEQLRNRGLLYLTQFLAAATSRLPAMLLLEDLHWADNPSLDALEDLIRRLAHTRTLIVALARPVLYERRPTWGKDHDTVWLMPLSESASQQLLAEILQRVSDLPPALADLLVSRAEGNPFYLEELVKMLIEDGVITTAATPWRVALDKLAGMKVPETLTGVIQSRLDRLPTSEKEALQQASVIGRVFWDAAVDHLAGSLTAGARLAGLRARELAFPHGRSAFAGTSEYAFKHALLRDVTYETVLKRLRSKYHALTAEWLAGISASQDRSDHYAGPIADHYELAGMQDPARMWHRRAGVHAADRFSNDEAMRRFSRALELTAEDDLTARLDLLLAREQILDRQAERIAQADDLDTLERLAARCDDTVRRAQVSLRRSSYCEVTGNYGGALTAARSALSDARAVGDEACEGQALLCSGRALWRQGDHAGAQPLFEQALEIAVRRDDARGQRVALNNLGLVSTVRNAYVEARMLYDRALHTARRIGDRTGEGILLNNLGVVAERQGDYAGAREYYRQALDIAQETGDRQGHRSELNNLGVVAQNLGDLAEAQTSYEQALEISREIGDRHGEARALNNLGDLARIRGRHREARRLLRAARTIAIEIGDRESEGIALNGLGFVAWLQGKHAEALQHFEQARNTLAEIGCTDGEAWALTGRGHAYAGSGRPDLAGESYLAAIAAHARAEQSTGEMEARAGLASLDLARGDLAAATVQVRAIADYVAGRAGSPTAAWQFEGAYDPLWILLVWYRVLAAAQDPSAREPIQRACDALQAQVQRLEDAPGRDRFLRGAPYHAEIIAAHAQLAGGSLLSTGKPS